MINLEKAKFDAKDAIITLIPVYDSRGIYSQDIEGLRNLSFEALMDILENTIIRNSRVLVKNKES